MLITICVIMTDAKPLIVRIEMDECEKWYAAWQERELPPASASSTCTDAGWPIPEGTDAYKFGFAVLLYTADANYAKAAVLMKTALSLDSTLVSMDEVDVLDGWCLLHKQVGLVAILFEPEGVGIVASIMREGERRAQDFMKSLPACEPAPTSSFEICFPIKDSVKAKLLLEDSAVYLHSNMILMLQAKGLTVSDDSPLTRAQILLFYADAVHMVETGEPLFELAPAACTDGPVYKLAREHLNNNLNRGPFTESVTVLRDVLTAEQKQLLNDVLAVLGDPVVISIKQLIDLSHHEYPWSLVREYVKEEPRMSNRLMVQWFSEPRGQVRINDILELRKDRELAHETEPVADKRLYSQISSSASPA
jgi:uncharacterized phage-associated protein